MRNLTELGPRERRALGALLEKQQTTPEYYPLTLKAAVAACNQKSNRDPVMSLGEKDVHNVLRVLQQENLVERETGVRVDRWRHRVDEELGLRPDAKALITLLLLRGPQTPGELRGRSQRLHAFETVGEVEQALQALRATEPPLVVQLARRPGQSQSRWNLALPEQDQAVPEPESEQTPPEPGLHARVSRLEEQVAELREIVDRLAGLGR